MLHSIISSIQTAVLQKYARYTKRTLGILSYRTFSGTTTLTNQNLNVDYVLDSKEGYCFDLHSNMIHDKAKIGIVFKIIEKRIKKSITKIKLTKDFLFL